MDWIRHPAELTWPDRSVPSPFAWLLSLVPFWFFATHPKKKPNFDGHYWISLFVGPSSKKAAKNDIFIQHCPYLAALKPLVITAGLQESTRIRNIFLDTLFCFYWFCKIIAAILSFQQQALKNLLDFHSKKPPSLHLTLHVLCTSGVYKFHGSLQVPSNALICTQTWWMFSFWNKIDGLWKLFSIQKQVSPIYTLFLFWAQKT